MSIRANLVSALRTFLTLNGRPEADSLVTALDDYIAYKIEQQPLQLLTINGERVEGPLAPAILKIVNDAIKDYHEQVAVPPAPSISSLVSTMPLRPLTPLETENSEKILRKLGMELCPQVYDVAEPESLPDSTVRRIEAAQRLAEEKCERDETESEADKLVEFERLISAQRAAARAELIRAEQTATEHQSPRCQHDLTQPIATRHVVVHTDSRITTKCFACGEVRTYQYGVNANVE